MPSLLRPNQRVLLQEMKGFFISFLWKWLYFISLRFENFCGVWRTKVLQWKCGVSTYRCLALLFLQRKLPNIECTETFCQLWGAKQKFYLGYHLLTDLWHLGDLEKTSPLEKKISPFPEDIFMTEVLWECHVFLTCIFIVLTPIFSS